MDQRPGAEIKVSLTWPGLRFQLEALTQIPEYFSSGLFHKVGILEQ